MSSKVLYMFYFQLQGMDTKHNRKKLVDQLRQDFDPSITQYKPQIIVSFIGEHTGHQTGEVLFCTFIAV